MQPILACLAIVYGSGKYVSLLAHGGNADFQRGERVVLGAKSARIAIEAPGSDLGETWIDIKLGHRQGWRISTRVWPELFGRADRSEILFLVDLNKNRRRGFRFMMTHRRNKE